MLAGRRGQCGHQGRASGAGLARDLSVEENNLQVQVSALRKALDEDQSGQSYLITVPGRGYRFIGLVESSNEPALPDKPSIAVLPFQNMSDDPKQEYFADGMVEDITTALSATCAGCS